MTDPNDNHDIENLLIGDADAEVPPEVQARLRHRLADFRERMKQAETPPKESILIMIMPKVRSRKVAWASAAILAVLVIASLSNLDPRGTGSGRAYAAVVEQIRKARTISYEITISPVMEGMPPTTMEMQYKEPGLLRMNMQMGVGGAVGVYDFIAKKGMSVIGLTKQFIEEDLSKLPPDKARAQMNYIDEMKTLPDRADEVLGEKEIDGRTVQGFRIVQDHLDGLNKTVWVDVETGNLVRIEGEFANAEGVHVTMTDFQFDIDLPDSLFDLTPPEGYTRLNVQTDSSEPDEEDFIGFLRFVSGCHEDGLFPPSLNPVEFIKFTKSQTREGKFSEPDVDPTSDEGMQKVFNMTRGVMFTLQMKPENDWHYAGEGVRLGDAGTPVCWYKPTGSDLHRVIYADLTVRDVAPEDVPAR